MNTRKLLIELMIKVYGNHCTLCQGLFNEEDPPELDHTTPRHQGGSDTLDNLRLAHKVCNIVKGGGKRRNQAHTRLTTDEEILLMLAQCKGDKTKVAEMLAIPLRTVYRRLDRIVSNVKRQK